MFHNIFKNNKLQKKEKIITIIADIHEKDSNIFAELKSSNNLNLIIKSLKIGDYQIGDIIIERKTSSDFVLSMINKRLINQLNQLKEIENKLLILEGDINDLKNTKINPNAIKGFILTIILKFKIPIIFTKDIIETASYLVLLSKKQEKNKNKDISLHFKIPKTIESQKEYILESFPNIGPKKAKKLINKFKSLNNIFNATEQDLTEILNNKSKDFKNIIDYKSIF